MVQQGKIVPRKYEYGACDNIFEHPCLFEADIISKELVFVSIYIFLKRSELFMPWHPG